MIHEENEYLTAKKVLEIEVGESVKVTVTSKEKFRKYLSDLSRKNQMQFITRTPDATKVDVLEVSRFK